MMKDDELACLGGDIAANGLRETIKFRADELLDGRNRMEAMQRAGMKAGPRDMETLPDSVDPVAYVISANINRRHLTKQQKADLIVAARKAAEQKPRQVDEVSKGGRGKVDPVKAAAVKDAAEHGISKSTVERSFAKANGKTPKPKVAPPVADDEPADHDTPQQFWERSLSYHAGESIAMQAAWTKQHGKAWKQFPVTDELVTLASQAAKAWNELSGDLYWRGHKLRAEKYSARKAGLSVEEWRRVRKASPGDRAKVQKIQRMTVANGCTEAEAEAAAAKLEALTTRRRKKKVVPIQD